MSDYYMNKILEDNGFSYHNHKFYQFIYVIDNLNILNYEPIIDYVGVDKYAVDGKFYVYINFKEHISHYLPSFGLNLNLDMKGYKNGYVFHRVKSFSSNEEVIEELHRLNSIGLNIKGAKK